MRAKADKGGENGRKAGHRNRFGGPPKSSIFQRLAGIEPMGFKLVR
jgi:hypothetical protein